VLGLGRFVVEDQEASEAVRGQAEIGVLVANPFDRLRVLSFDRLVELLFALRCGETRLLRRNGYGALGRGAG
jgi:hypothetical protein